MGRRLAPKKRSRWGLFLTLAIVIPLIIWIPFELHLSNNVPQAESVTVQSSRLPAAFEGFRIMHLSDLHEVVFPDGNEPLFSLIADASPDIIAITGDTLDKEEGLAYVEDLIPRLAAIAPTYFVTGNHEWAADGDTAHRGRNRLINRLERAVEEAGGVWLDSRFMPLWRGGEYIIIGGICDPIGARSDPAIPDAPELLSKIYREHPEQPFTLLLSHRSKLDFNGFDVVLAGHTHGGVIRLPFTDGLISTDRGLFPQGTSGVLRSGTAQVVVSRGIGGTYAPRFLNRPQVLTVVLER